MVIDIAEIIIIMIPNLDGASDSNRVWNYAGPASDHVGGPY